jgi:hypothetical protein
MKKEKRYPAGKIRKADAQKASLTVFAGIYCIPHD